MSKKVLNILRVILITLSILALAIGIKNKQPKGVFIKATNI